MAKEKCGFTNGIQLIRRAEFALAN